MNLSLYEIDEKINALLDEAVDPETGELRPEFEQEFDLLQMAREEKIRNYALVIKSKNVLVEGAKKEIERLRKIIDSEKKQVDFLKNRLAEALEYKPIKTPEFKVSFRKSESVEQELPQIDQPTAASLNKIIPGAIKEVVKYVPVKAVIKNALKDGHRVDGFVLVEKLNISVK